MAQLSEIQAARQRLQQLSSKSVPQSETLLQSVIRSQRPGGTALNIGGAIIPSTVEEATDIPKALAGATGVTSGLVGTGARITDPRPTALEGPQTQFGQNIQTAGIAAPAVLGAGGIGNVIKSIAQNPNKLVQLVQGVQKAFVPGFVKKAQGKFGSALRKSTRTALEEGRFNVPDDEIKAITQSDDISRLSPKNKKIMASLEQNLSGPKTKTEFGPRGIRQVSAGRGNTVLDQRRAVTKLQRTINASDTSEEAVAARQTVERLKKSLSKRLTGMEEANREYAIFNDDKAILERFSPEKLGRSESGTEAGTKILSTIKGEQPGVMSALKRFESDTGVKFVDEAIKIQNNVQRAKFIKGSFVGIAVSATIWKVIGEPITKMADAVSGSKGDFGGGS